MNAIMSTQVAHAPVTMFLPCWHNIRWKPNLSTGELLNIGVVHRDRAGAVSVRLLDTFERIKCLYDDTLAEQAEFLVSVIREAARRDIDDIPSPQVSLSEPKAASESAADALLDALYQATVPLARPRNAAAVGAVDKAKPQPTNSVRAAVFDELRRLTGPNAEKVLRSTPYLEVRDGERTHYLDIPLQAQSALGTVVSARQKTFQGAEVDMGRAETDLLVAQRRFRHDRLMMYIVRKADGSYGGKSAVAMDEWFDKYSWKLNQIGIQLKTSTAPEETAADIVEDMRVMA